MNWTTVMNEVLSDDNTTQTDASVTVCRDSDGCVVRHAPSAIAARGDDQQTAVLRLRVKLLLLTMHDRTVEPLSRRAGMSRLGVNELDEVLHDHAYVTQAAIEQGYIEVRREFIDGEDIPPACWRAVSGITEVRGEDIHTELAAALDALLRAHGFRILTHEYAARYGPDNTGPPADVAVPHVGIYCEAGSLSSSDKIATCLGIGRDGTLWSLQNRRLAEAPHVFHQPPANPIHEVVFLPFFEGDARLLERTDVTLPVFVFTRTDKELRRRRG